MADEDDKRSGGAGGESQQDQRAGDHPSRQTDTHSDEVTKGAGTGKSARR